MQGVVIWQAGVCDEVIPKIKHSLIELQNWIIQNKKGCALRYWCIDLQTDCTTLYEQLPVLSAKISYFCLKQERLLFTDDINNPTIEIIPVLYSVKAQKFVGVCLGKIYRETVTGQQLVAYGRSWSVTKRQDCSVMEIYTQDTIKQLYHKNLYNEIVRLLTESQGTYTQKELKDMMALMQIPDVEYSKILDFNIDVGQEIIYIVTKQQRNGTKQYYVGTTNSTNLQAILELPHKNCNAYKYYLNGNKLCLDEICVDDSVISYEFRGVSSKKAIKKLQHHILSTGFYPRKYIFGETKALGDFVRPKICEYA